MSKINVLVRSQREADLIAKVVEKDGHQIVAHFDEACVPIPYYRVESLDESEDEIHIRARWISKPPTEN